MQCSIPYTDEDVSNLTYEQPSMNPRQQPESKGGNVKPPTSGIYCMEIIISLHFLFYDHNRHVYCVHILIDAVIIMLIGCVTISFLKFKFMGFSVNKLLSYSLYYSYKC